MAMPMSNLGAVDVGVKADSVRWVCNAWGRCWHRPNYYGAYGYYPRYRYRHYGRRWRKVTWARVTITQRGRNAGKVTKPAVAPNTA